MLSTKSVYLNSSVTLDIIAQMKTFEVTNILTLFTRSFIYQVYDLAGLRVLLQKI